MRAILLVTALLLTGCAASVGDNSFGARASRGVKRVMSYEMCPYGTAQSDIRVGSRIDIQYNSRARYSENTVSVREEYGGRRGDNCLPAPVVKPSK